MIKKVRVIKDFPGASKGTILKFIETLDAFKSTYDSIISAVSDCTNLKSYNMFTRDEIEKGVREGYFEVIVDTPTLRTIEDILKRKRFFEKALADYVYLNKDLKDEVPAIVFANLIDLLSWVLGEEELEYNEWSEKIRNGFKDEDDN